MSTIVVDNVSKTYKNSTAPAVYQASINVERGELFGLVGPDGAGKTTLIRMITTLLLPDSGTVTVDGFDVTTNTRHVRSIIGYMPGKFSLYQDLTVEENLTFFATLFGTTVEKNYHLVKDIYRQLEPFKDRRSGKLSGGMKQKLALCCALIHKPSLMILDEPTTGVDPVSRSEFWDMLGGLKNDGISILVSTPYMDEANLCDRIALMQTGRILDVDIPERIVSKFSRPLYAMKSTNMYNLRTYLRDLPLVHSSLLFGEYMHVSFIDPSGAEVGLQQINAAFPSVEFFSISPTIEDCFIDLLHPKEHVHE